MRLSLAPFDLPTQRGNARGEIEAREGWLVRVSDGRRAGYGEATPLRGHSRETPHEAACALSSLRDLGSDPMRAVTRIDVAEPSARCAIECALLDLVAQAEGVPLASLLGATDPSPVPVAALIHDLPSATAAIAAGYRTLKLKVGRDVPREVALLGQLGDRQVALRIDANGTVGAEAFEPLHLEWIEEPLGESALPIALDESLALDAEERIATRRPFALVLKPMAIGGALRCLAIARFGAAYGARAVASHLFGGPCALAFSAALAHALPERTLAAGLGPYPGADAALPIREGHLAPSSAVGLDVDRAALERTFAEAT